MGFELQIAFDVFRKHLTSVRITFIALLCYYIYNGTWKLGKIMCDIVFRQVGINNLI